MLVAAALVALALPASFAVEPREATYGPDAVFRVDSRTPVVLPDDAPEQLRQHIGLLFETTGIRLPVVEAAEEDGRGRGIYIGPHGSHASFTHRRLRHAMRNLAPPEPGAYNMVIDSDRVIITGGDMAGTFYGIVMLARMLERSPNLPRLDAKDYPNLPVRGVSMKGRPTPSLINGLAAGRCNLLLVQSDDFLNLSGSVRQHWEGLFDGARQYHVELVPILPETTVEALIGVVRAFRPEHVHIGDAWAPDAAGYRALLEKLAGAAEQLDPDLRLMAWAEPIDTTERGPYPQYDGIAGRLPGNMVWVSRSSDAAASLAWASGAGLTMLAGAGASQQSAYAATSAAISAGAPGVVVHWDGEPTEPGLDAARVAFAKGWNPATQGNAWAGGLNAFFGTDFWEPGFSDLLPTFIRFLNQQTLMGRSPTDIDRDFSTTLRGIRSELPSSETHSVFAETTFRAVLDYVRLEAAYATDRNRATLGSLVELVNLHARLNPAFTNERRDRVIEVINNTGLFVPSTILLGTGTGPGDSGYLLPYRPLPSAGGMPMIVSLATPSYEDSEDLARADIRFGAPIGPIARIDFETVGTAELIIAASDDGATYRTIETVNSSQAGGVRAPALLQRATATPYLRVAAIAPAEQAVLKEVQVSAYKEPAALVAFRMPNAPRLDGDITQGEWGGEAGQGFVRTDRRAFAEAQSLFFTGYDADALYIAVRAIEPRMDTMLARATGRDEAIWEEESIEVLIRPTGAPPVRLLVNPLGAQSDALNWNPAWQGNWEAETRLLQAEWVVEMRIPFATLGARPGPGDRWGLNVVRNRRNVRSEQSTWHIGEEHHGDPAAYGVLVFN